MGVPVNLLDTPSFSSPVGHLTSKERAGRYGLDGPLPHQLPGLDQGRRGGRCIFILRFPSAVTERQHESGPDLGGRFHISLLGRLPSDTHPHSSSLAPGHPCPDFPSQTLEPWCLGIILPPAPYPTMGVGPRTDCPDHSCFLWNSNHSSFREGLGKGQRQDSGMVLPPPFTFSFRNTPFSICPAAVC